MVRAEGRAVSKTLVLGRGLLGQAFERAGFEVWGREVVEVHLRGNPSRDVAHLLRSHGVTAVVNCIGKPTARECEEPDNWPAVYAVNSAFPGFLQRECRRGGATLVHISTGCVYTENPGVCVETTPTSSHSRYVLSKLVGEYNLHGHEDTLILRPRLLFDHSNHPNNLLNKLRAFPAWAVEANTVTSTVTVVEATAALLDAGARGVFNVGNRGPLSMHDIGYAITGELRPETSSAHLAAERPFRTVDMVMSMAKLVEHYVPDEAINEVRRAAGLAPHWHS